jgi:DNA-directed RNA polymerase subunit beta'
VDAAQNILIREQDCGTVHYDEVHRDSSKSLFGDSFEDKILSKYLARDIVDAQGKVLFPTKTLINKELLVKFQEQNINQVAVRSILTCETEEGVCQMCYGLDLAHNSQAEMGTPVGIIAAQSIGEPGTQLTMRTFHSG